MQALQFSYQPRPNIVTIAYSTEPATSNSPIPYSGWSRAPQAARQPTPFVPRAQPVSSTGLSPPAAGHSPSPSATAFSIAPGRSFQNTQVIVHQNSVGTPTNSSSLPLLFAIPAIKKSCFRKCPGVCICNAVYPYVLIGRGLLVCPVAGFSWILMGQR